MSLSSSASDTVRNTFSMSPTKAFLCGRNLRMMSTIFWERDEPVNRQLFNEVPLDLQGRIINNSQLRCLLISPSNSMEWYVMNSSNLSYFWFADPFHNSILDLLSDTSIIFKQHVWFFFKAMQQTL